MPVGGVCVADVQFKGRGSNIISAICIGILLYILVIFVFVLVCEGRSTNVWQSPKGCLMYSFTIQMEDGRVVPLVQYVVSLAMTEAINDVCQKNVRASS